MRVKDEISKMYGGDSTSAYMLQYRRYDPSLTMSGEGSEALKIEIPDDLCPLYQRQDIDAETDKLL